MSSKLPACPFCGFVHCTVSRGSISKWSFVYCPGCLAEGPACNTEDEAIAAWTRRAPTQQPSGAPSLKNPMVRFPTKEDIREWEEAQAKHPDADGWLQSGGLLYRLTDERHPQNRDEINVTMANGSRDDAPRAARASEILALIAGTRHPSGEPASAGVIAAALAVIEADRAHVLTDGHIDALENAIRIQRGELKLPEARAKLPRFPVVLRKMWSGGEVQRWIDENVALRTAALQDALDHIARVARGTREQSRRQRWIELRALGALNGTDEWRTLPLPRNGETVRRRLMHTIDELRAENAELRALVPHTSPAVRAILAERRRRVEQEGWTPGHDDACARGELARASATYALSASGYYTRGDGTRAAAEDTEWPWAPEWWRPTTPRSDMVKSVALGLSELERLDRTAAREGDGHAA
ncbi:Lar family restriction alleviation protein [Burkholderia ubonensis]|uniref:Lar family restriction alleviation protein n=1 Tax=Burkholderia ubonensis TaxID=101571 RepID=UPI000ADD1EA5|nr:Lar family restriction alleviation protein [Burkholderia ubonensis]